MTCTVHLKSLNKTQKVLPCKMYVSWWLKTIIWNVYSLLVSQFVGVSLRFYSGAIRVFKKFKNDKKAQKINIQKS